MSISGTKAGIVLSVEFNTKILNIGCFNVRGLRHEIITPKIKSIGTPRTRRIMDNLKMVQLLVIKFGKFRFHIVSNQFVWKQYSKMITKCQYLIPKREHLILPFQSLSTYMWARTQNIQDYQDQN